MGKFEKRLDKKGLEDSTQKKYADIIESAGNADLLDWINIKVKDKTPLGTVLPMRAAVKHYLISEYGYSAEDLDELLPKAEGKASVTRLALTPSQLATYHAAVDRHVPDPSKTILALLPMTGMKIAEICELGVSSVVFRGDKSHLSLSKDGSKRTIPLTRSAVTVLRRYIETHKPDSALFRISPHGVRKYTRKIGDLYKDLKDLSPEVLRVTFAVLAIKQGMDMAEVGQTLGHQNLATTRRYLDQVI